MSRLALPQNYTKSEGTSIEDFDTLAEWTLISLGTKELDTINFKSSNASIKLTTASGGITFVYKSISLDMSEKSKKISLWFYVYDADSVAQIIIGFSSGPVYSAKNFVLGTTQVHTGWNKFSIGRADWVNTGGDSWSNLMTQLRVTVKAKPGQIALVSFDSVLVDEETLPRCLLTFDDGYDDVYNEAFAYMQPRGLKGTSYVPGSLIEGGTGFMTKAQLAEMYASGWAIGNHTYNHVDMSVYTQAQAYAELKTNRDWLIANGYTRAADHVCYPVGGYNADVLLAMAQVGAKTGRTTKSNYQYTADHLYELTIKEISNNTTLEAAKSVVNSAISRQATVVLMLHKLVENPAVSTEWSISNFRGLVDFLVARKIKVVTIDEWYEGLTNPRYQSLPLSREVV